MKRGEDGKWRTAGGVEITNPAQIAELESKGVKTPTTQRYATLYDLIEAYPLGKRFRIEHDGFVGTVCGWYVRDDGRPGVDLQLEGARVVHVYGLKWLVEA